MSEHATITDFTAPPIVATWRSRSLIVGAVFAIAAIIGFVIEPVQALHSYLIAYFLVLGLTLGCMGWLMMWHLTGGTWGVPIRRILEAAVATLPLIFILWIPLAFGAKLIYPWTHADVQAVEKLTHQSTSYLSMTGFILRAFLMFISWALLAWYLLSWSREQDTLPVRAFGPRFRAVSGVGLVIYAWTLTFITVDLIMSLTAGWTSTIYGLIFLVGQALIAMCFVVLVAHALRMFHPLRALLTPHNFHDYGKLMLACTMLWAYFSFSQWLIIWSGNLPEETKWFIQRIHGHWGAIALAIVVGHFVIPFCLLLSRPLKRDSSKLIWIAAWLILMRYLDLYWHIQPALNKEHLHYSWLDAVVPIAMVAVWAAYFFWQLARRPLVVLNDPALLAYMEGEHE